MASEPYAETIYCNCQNNKEIRQNESLKIRVNTLSFILSVLALRSHSDYSAVSFTIRIPNEVVKES
jgi:hypothetical protein